MTVILDFTIQSRSDDDQYTSDMSVSVPKLCKKHKLNISVR